MRWDGVVTANPGEEETRGNEGVKLKAGGEHALLKDVELSRAEVITTSRMCSNERGLTRCLVSNNTLCTKKISRERT
jgi:hypothetical protein